MVADRLRSLLIVPPFVSTKEYLMKIAQHTFAALGLLVALALPAAAQESVGATKTKQPVLMDGPNNKSFWGWGLGLVFTEVPISESKFTVLMSDLHYGYYLTDPNDYVRTAATLGLFGFALVLPVPKVGVEMILGDPSQDIQGKLGADAFYDISVGGHGGVAGSLGVRIKNKVDVSFFVVPAGFDSKRDYLEFVGVRDEPGTKPYVIMPYFGLFVGFNY
jgi:hypothetical protein